MKRLYLRNFHVKGILEAGCDEAGRGCLAGPVFAAAVILPPGFRHALLNDSKKLNAPQRQEMRAFIEARATSWAVGSASREEIDHLNILNAAILAMHRAVQKLPVKPETLIIDGNRFHPYPGIPHHCAIGGDGRYKHIAAASILAKTYRDEHMASLACEYPQYQWSRNKGYGTEDHRRAIREYGISVHHRRSFKTL